MDHEKSNYCNDMKKIKLLHYCTLLAMVLISCNYQENDKSILHYKSILTGIPWYTENGENVSAHGANIIKEGEMYYIFGEYKNDTDNKFEGFSCYASTDLKNWKFESIALKPNLNGRLSGPGCIGERPKVMKCPSTGEFIMYFHADSSGYNKPAIEYAVAQNITGPYEYRGPLLFGDKQINRWDMGSFQDEDGTGYIIIHHGNIYKLSEDYKSIVEQTLKNEETLKTESPAVFKHNGIYYWIGSGLTGWERNDNHYFTALSLAGPWTDRGIIAPEGSLTWNSQSSFVFPIVGSKDTTYMYMGDRWSFPKQRSTATYVWQPLVFNGDEISMPKFHESWAINTKTGEWKDVPLKPKYEISYDDKAVSYVGKWELSTGDKTLSQRANTKDAKMSFKFNGSQIALRGVASIDCGYGQITITNSDGVTVHDTWIDMYSNKTVEGLQYMSPVLPKGVYTLNLSPTQTHWYWKTKSGKEWGSKDTYISFYKALVF